MAIAKEQLQQIIADNDIKSVGDIYSLFKDSFKDMLQELLEAELNATLGYEKNKKEDSVKIFSQIVFQPVVSRL